MLSVFRFHHKALKHFDLSSELEVSAVNIQVMSLCCECCSVCVLSIIPCKWRVPIGFLFSKECSGNRVKYVVSVRRRAAGGGDDGAGA